jgi:hypothetical protein
MWLKVIGVFIICFVLGALIDKYPNFSFALGVGLFFIMLGDWINVYEITKKIKKI